MKLLFGLVTLLLTTIGFAQNTKAKTGSKPQPGKISVIARAYNDSILLRWGATTPIAWKNCNKYGVRVERVTMYRDGKLVAINQRDKKILATKLLPLPEKEWEPLANKNDAALMEAMALYGTSLDVSPKGKPDIMTMVNMATELENRHGMALLAADQSPEVATAAAVRWKDTDIKQNEKYLYLVYALLPDASVKIDTGYVFIDASERFEIPKPMDVQVTFEDKVAKLSWNRKYFEYIFTGYRVERSDDGGKTFHSLDKSLFINTVPEGKENPERMYRIDSLPINDKIFVYRVKGITPFGEVSPPSDPVEGMGKEKVTYVNPNITEVINKNNKEILIKWKYPAEHQNKIQGFIISRAKSADSVFRDIITKPLLPSTREFTDPKPGKVNYYKVKAIDMNGNIASSFPAYGQLIDSIPPMPPVGMSGKIDSNGMVTLKWKRGKDDDLYGYRVYRGNSMNEEFSQVTRATITDTTFIDTIETKTLTKKVFYKIMALDQNYNASKFSTVLELKRPDKFPPVPPRFKNIFSSDSGVYIQWFHSTSNDVVKELLYRSEENANKYVLVAISDSSNKLDHFTDKQIEKGKTYLYTLVAVDDSKLESEPEKPLSGRMIDTYVRPAISKIEDNVDLNAKSISLKWTYEEKGVNNFIIYRAENDGAYRIYKSISAINFQFTDANLKISSVYKYRIKASFSDGAQSELSREIVVKY